MWCSLDGLTLLIVLPWCGQALAASGSPFDDWLLAPAEVLVKQALSSYLPNPCLFVSPEHKNAANVMLSVNDDLFHGVSSLMSFRVSYGEKKWKK